MANYGPPGGPEPWPGRRPDGPYEPPADPWGVGDQRGDPRNPPPSGYPPPGREQRYPPPDPEYGYPTPGPEQHHPRYGPQQGYPEYPSHPEYPQPGYPQPGYPQQGYRPHELHPEHAPPPGYPRTTSGPDWSAPDPAPAPRRSRGPLIAVLTTLMVLVCGGGAAVYYLRGQDDPPPSTDPTTVPSGALPTTEPTEPAEPAATTPAVESSTDPRFVKVGQCVRNEGPAGGQPKLAITECGPKTYQVLRRFDGATSGEKDAEAKCAKVDGYTNWYFFNSPLDTLDFVLCLKSR